MNRKIYQQNLDLWSKSSPMQAVRLPYVDVSHLTPCLTEKMEQNLENTRDKHFFLHSQEGALQEAKSWFNGLTSDLHKTSVLFVYGVGLGYAYEAAKAWLKGNKKRRLVFLEDDLAVISRLFETENGSEILNDPQVQLIYFQDLNEEEAAFEILYWDFALTPILVSALPAYSREKPGIFAELRHKIAYDSAVKNALVDEYLRFGGAFFLNFYPNMLCLADSYYGNQFFGKFPKVPAIICGAGPSLDKNLPLLSTLLDKALIFAGGSALNGVNSYGFQPHFGAGIDPNPMQLDRLSKSQGHEVPFFYRNRLFHQAFRTIHGPKLYITGCGGYEVAEWFEGKFGMEAGFLDEGHNVVNFCVEVAHAMGCDPIIFVGMDLAFTGLKSYVQGVVEDTSVSESELLSAEDEDSKVILQKDIYGQPIYTLWKWMAEAQWIGDFAKNHPFLTMVNCTEGGLGFPGIENRPLSEIADKSLTRCYELSDRVHGETQNSLMPQVTYRKVAKAARELAASLKNIVQQFALLIEETRALQQKIEAGADPTSPLSGRAVLAETDLEDEPGYKHVVEVFNVVYSRLLTRNLHEINSSRISRKKKAIKRLDLNLQRFKFLQEVAQVNIDVIAYAFKERKKLKKSPFPEGILPKLVEGVYRVENKTLKIQDPELGIDLEVPFDPWYIPEVRKDRQEIGENCYLRVILTDDWKEAECSIEKEGRREGQCLLFYSNGAIKEETFYTQGQLHGPSTFWDPEGRVLARSWYVRGKREGKSYWYYPSGILYSLQRWKGGERQGWQEYYYETGKPKTFMNYKDGKLLEVRKSSYSLN